LKRKSNFDGVFNISHRDRDNPNCSESSSPDGGRFGMHGWCVEEGLKDESEQTPRRSHELIQRILCCNRTGGFIKTEERTRCSRLCR
jgi:hypothetical protein